MSTTLYGFSLRGILFRGRTAGFAVLPLVVAVVVFVVIAITSVQNRYGVQNTFTGNLLTGLVVPIVALVLAIGAFGDERDARTLPLLRAIARPRWHTVVARFAAAWTATVVVSAPAVIACAVLGISVNQPAGRVVGGVLLATVLTSGAYCAFFLLLSLLTRRGLLAGLAYLVLWETFLAGLAPALRGLSIGSYGRRVAALAIPGDVPLGTVSSLGATGASLVLAGITVVAVVLSAVRLQRMDV
ncbi:ABC transporter permease subunit [Kineococcus rhizosphaerae]|uniref:ABC-2 type transport system permease protein n=1 Tax=Kineococcus rhizosphaerae TaxID=559628 RepID=A0A2T0R1K2_9ACTN|nr:ABC transporter permease subunit [Kineococcus rhizosphaerae]PRY13432.1 ABC-2 type transport system permease protein [Kineococcus rhizosphaerae]